MVTRIISFLFLLCFVYAVSCKAQTITPEHAKDSVGKTITVCGEVTGSSVSKNGTHFLNFGDDYPNQQFTAVIYEDYAKLFPTPPAEYYRGKQICVTGVIKLYKEKPEIEVEKPEQISLKDVTK